MGDSRHPPVRVIACDELGQLKVSQAPDLAHLDALSVVSRWGVAERSQSAECMAVGSAGGLTDTATAAMAVGRVDGSIELMDPCTGRLHWRLAGDASCGRTAAVRGVHLVYGSTAELPAVLSCTQGGAARLHTAPGADDGEPQQILSWAAPDDVFCTAFDPDSGLLAVGCKGTELRLYDTATAQPAFVAKGGRPNAVGLPDRPWNSAAAFLPGKKGTQVAVGTGYHKLRLYDTRAGKRPQVDVPFGEARITALAPEADGLRCWVANGVGQVEAYDWRAAKFCGAVKGVAGSVRSLALHPDSKVLASAGLDRFLRLHDTATRRPLGKVYLKMQLTGVAFCPTDASMAAAPAAAAAGGRGERRAGAGEEDAGRERGGKGAKRRGEEGGGGQRGKTRRPSSQEGC